MDDAVADFHVDPHLFLQFTRERRLVALAFFNAAPGKLPEEREARRRPPLRNQVLAVLFQHGGYDAHLGGHGAAP